MSENKTITVIHLFLKKSGREVSSMAGLLVALYYELPHSTSPEKVFLPGKASAIHKKYY